MSIATEKYVRLTTFTRDGRRKESPVWIAEVDNDALGFTTGLGSWKVKRINNTPSVELTPSDAKGRIGDDAESVTGQARVVTGSEFTAVATAIKAKYGIQVSMMLAVSRVGKLIGKGDASNCAIIVTLDRPSKTQGRVRP
ncbi:MAG: PPOX class F420-dependent oxidoreductase [Actinobacteria bacterium]|nr:PPOX class F420-dependent oxidoreductase [Actinomycetota bacterium]